MIMKRVLFLTGSLICGVAAAAPFLTSDPSCFDVSGANASCPFGYEYSEDSENWFPLDSQATDTTIIVWHDMGGLDHGVHSWSIRAVNNWGESDTVPFEFTTGVPVGPGGLRIVAP
jgi:hypothetical protein